MIKAFEGCTWCVGGGDEADEWDNVGDVRRDDEGGDDAIAVDNGGGCCCGIFLFATNKEDDEDNADTDDADEDDDDDDDDEGEPFAVATDENIAAAIAVDDDVANADGCIIGLNVLFVKPNGVCRSNWALLLLLLLLLKHEVFGYPSNRKFLIKPLRLLSTISFNDDDDDDSAAEELALSTANDTDSDGKFLAELSINVWTWWPLVFDVFEYWYCWLVKLSFELDKIDWTAL